MSKRMLAAVLILSSLGCSVGVRNPSELPSFAKAAKRPQLEKVEKVKKVEKLESSWARRACMIDEGYLKYSFPPDNLVKKLRFVLGRNEKILASRCGEKKTLILTNKALYVYPGAADLRKKDPKEFDYLRITGPYGFEEGRISQREDLFLVRFENKVEAYRLTPSGLSNVLSYSILRKVRRVFLDDEKRHIIVYCEGGSVVFNYEGELVEGGVEVE